MTQEDKTVTFYRPKAQWGPGPWQSEPDRVEFRHAGLPCLMVRNNFGAWCGYVGMPPGHPGRELGQFALDLVVSVHGGLTYGPAACDGPICHVPLDGESDDVVWVGFDCHHAGDFGPGMDLRYSVGRGRDVYRDEAWVRGQVAGLAQQLQRRPLDEPG